jgi:hypothetical protein
MFTYKFVGLTATDAPTAYTYGSLPAKPELGHIIVYEQSGNRYAVIRIEGEGLVGDDDSADQRELAWTEIGQGKTVPTVWLQKLLEEIQARGRSFSYEEVKEYSQKNRETRSLRLLGKDTYKPKDRSWLTPAFMGAAGCPSVFRVRFFSCVLPSAKDQPSSLKELGLGWARFLPLWRVAHP